MMELMALVEVSWLDLAHASIDNFITNPIIGNSIENRINSESLSLFIYAVVGPNIRYNDIKKCGFTLPYISFV